MVFCILEKETEVIGIKTFEQRKEETNYSFWVVNLVSDYKVIEAEDIVSNEQKN